MDRRLADGDGLSLISEIRAKQGNAAIMMLTALDAVDDRIQGLDTGADDYLTKPFSLDEMMARIRALLRRRFAGGSNTLAVGDLTLDTTSRACCVAGRPIVFSRRELQLLETLMRSANCVVSRESLIKDLYGDEALIQEHALTALVSRVRARLSGLKAHAYIHVAHGVGYLITDVEKKA
ncbi:MAG: response regulator transcription factor [Methylocystis sp.]|nr:response regulator transcription factor [Methylocystis sp.]